jgi:hypothetical protein
LLHSIGWWQCENTNPEHLSRLLRVGGRRAQDERDGKDEDVCSDLSRTGAAITSTAKEAAAALKGFR